MNSTLSKEEMNIAKHYGVDTEKEYPKGCTYMGIDELSVFQFGLTDDLI